MSGNEGGESGSLRPGLLSCFPWAMLLSSAVSGRSRTARAFARNAKACNSASWVNWFARTKSVAPVTAWISTQHSDGSVPSDRMTRLRERTDGTSKAVQKKFVRARSLAVATKEAAGKGIGVDSAVRDAILRNDKRTQGEGSKEGGGPGADFR